MKQCVVRSYSQKYTSPLTDLRTRLETGWTVKQSTPFMQNGTTEYIEYILEKDGAPDV